MVAKSNDSCVVYHSAKVRKWSEQENEDTMIETTKTMHNGRAKGEQECEIGLNQLAI